MVEKTTIKDFYNRILGYIEVDTVTGVKVAYDFYRRRLGKYDPRENNTRYFYGRILSNGDTTQSLVYNSTNLKN